MNERDVLTDDDIDALVDALEVWENKDASGEMMGDFMEAVILKDSDPTHPIALKRAEDKRMRRREKEIRKERSVILRAKLLTFRNERRVTRVEAFAQSLQS